MADDKIKTKQFLSARGIPVPKLFGIIKDLGEVDKFDFNSLPNNFALKPNKGFGGEGIIPVIDRKDQLYVTAGQKTLSRDEMKDHIRDIIDGRFSISNVGDYAFFEQYIIADERIGRYSFEGLPDIRVVVHNLIPVMAMLRLPTRESEGKANLHMGAVGVGIDIAKGETTFISYKNRIIEELPDGLGKIKGLKIPFWDKILNIASEVQLLTNLGYMAIDLCIDRNSGPVLLEINARAGLGVQIANLAPLRRRLERIEGVKVTTPTKGVRIAKDMFGNILEKEIENLSGKQIVGIEEKVEVIQKKGTFRLNAKVDTGSEVSVIDERTAKETGLLEDPDNYDSQKSTLKLKFSLKNKRIQTIAEVKRVPSKKYKMIIGSRDLKNFLIDSSVTTKKKIKSIHQPIIKATSSESGAHYLKIDQELAKIDSQIKLLYHLTPINLNEEKQRFLEDKNYNPQFDYPELKFDPLELTEELDKINPDDSELGQIFQEKKDEISKKIQLIESIGETKFTQKSVDLFGQPTIDELEKCKAQILRLQALKIEAPIPTYNEYDAKKAFEEVFERYGLKNLKVSIKESMVAGCLAGKNNTLFIKKNSKFTQQRIANLIVHEIETHMLTAENGKSQPYKIFSRGLPNYLKTQEGLAMWNVEQQQNRPFANNISAMRHVIGIYEAMHSSFSTVYQNLIELGLSEIQAIGSCIKAKRGLYDTSEPGAFTKDYIYYRGYHQVKNFVENGGDIKDLYLGKMDIADLEKVKRVKGINPPKILPLWLR